MLPVLAHEVKGAFRGPRPVGGIPLVLLHAFPLDRRMWADVVPLVAGASPVVVVDLPGLGDSPVPERTAPSVDAAADAVAHLMDDLGLRHAVLGGVSMGGYVALAFARRHPDRLDGLALLDTTCAADPPEAVERRVVTAQAVLGRAGTSVLLPMLDQLLGATTRESRPEVVAQVRGWMLAAPPEGVAWSQRAMAGRADTSTTLAGLHRPVAVIVGDEDGITGEEKARSMARLCRDVVLTVVPRAGHLSPVERPREVADALEDLMTRVHGRSADANGPGVVDVRRRRFTSVADGGSRSPR